MTSPFIDGEVHNQEHVIQHALLISGTISILQMVRTPVPTTSTV